MDYNPISNFFDKFKKILATGEESRNAICAALNKNLKGDFKPNQITTKGVVIEVQASPIVKNEIMMRKSQILADIKALLPESRFIDIR
jgi:hypothetical protein